MLLTVGAAILVIGVLIFVHELGHFMAAKSVGIGVPRFSIGLGPATPLSFRRGETEYVISWVPFGGYVKMASREEQEEVMASAEGGAALDEFPDHQLFENKPLWARIFVISAGVTMNLLFAWAAYVVLTVSRPQLEIPTRAIAAIDTTGLPATAAALARAPLGIDIVKINGDTVRSWNDVRDHVLDPTSDRLRLDFITGDPVILPIDGFAMDDRLAVWTALTPAREARVDEIEAGSPAEAAGFRVGDLVVGVDADTIAYWDDLVAAVSARPGDSIRMRVRRGEALVTLDAVPAPATRPNRETREDEVYGRLGIGGPVRRVRIGLAASIVHGGRRVVGDAELILVTLYGLITRRVSARELGGPILIGQISGQVAQQGLVPLIAFMALFSVNLAILNLLPIPVLDGGQLVFLVIEGIRGKPMPLELRIRLSQVGLMILLAIMALALTNDFFRLFSG